MRISSIVIKVAREQNLTHLLVQAVEVVNNFLTCCCSNDRLILTTVDFECNCAEDSFILDLL